MVAPLPVVVEIKRTLAGREKRFDCRLISGDQSQAVVLWVASEPMHVHGIDLPAGTLSLGYFWTDRHYNVYHWLDRSGRTVGFYFNICDRTRIDGQSIEWRDLVVDVLSTPAGRLEVLDEDELPADLDAETMTHIEAGKRAVLASPAALIAELEDSSRALLPSVFADHSGRGGDSV
jgi:uncharacterized protein